MAKTKYIKALKYAVDQPALSNCKMTREEIEAAINEISAQLRGPLCNEERLCLVADRSELRATLKLLDSQENQVVKPHEETLIDGQGPVLLL